MYYSNRNTLNYPRKRSSISLKDFRDVLFPFLGKNQRPRKEDLGKCHIYYNALPKIRKNNIEYSIKERDTSILTIIAFVIFIIGVLIINSGNPNGKAACFFAIFFFLFSLLFKTPTKHFNKMFGCYWEGKAVSSLQKLQSSSAKKITYFTSIKNIYIHYFETKERVSSYRYNHVSSGYIKHVPHYMINLVLKDGSEVNIFGFHYLKPETVQEFTEDLAHFLGVSIQIAPELEMKLQATSSPKTPSAPLY